MDVNLPLDPPVNNNLQATLYDRIDAITFEKIRVANSQLNSRLEIQEKILNKYRKEAEKIYDNQYRKVRREFRKIHRKKPDYIDDFEYGRSKQDSESKLSRARSLSDTSDCSYCRRYYSHHFHIKDQSKKKEETKKPVENDYFNARLRCFFLNMVNYVNNSQNSPGFLEEDGHLFTENDDSIRSDALNESVNTLHDLDEEAFEATTASRLSIGQSSFSTSGQEPRRLGSIPVKPSVVTSLRSDLDNVCTNGETVKRSHAGLRLEAISPRHRKTTVHENMKSEKREKRSRLQGNSGERMLSRSVDIDILKTGSLQTDIHSYSKT